MSLMLVIHNVRSAHNVGSLFRSADGAGVGKVYLTGYTPAPLDKFNRPQKEIAKTALGAQESVLWESVADARKCIEGLKEKGHRIVALEQAKNSVSLYEYVPHEHTALILGNEVEGIESEVLSLADDVVEIPMHGEKESLNVAVAGGIALFALIDS